MPLRTRYVRLGSSPVLDPLPLYEACEAAGVRSDFWGLANSIHCPVGMEPGSAWLIVSRTVGAALSKNAFQTITWHHDGTTTNFQNYVICSARLIGLNGDSKAPYLLELRDKRQVMKMATVDREYNVRRSTRRYDTATTDLYYTDSRNSGSDWTWQTMFANVWETLPSSIRGTTPTLPYTPASEPENFRFHGSSWEALGKILAAVQSVLCLDPIGNTFTVQRLGVTQTDLATQLVTLNRAGRKLLDNSPLTDLNLGIAPATMRFFFPKRMEEDGDLMETDAGGPLVDPYHTIDKTTSITGAQAGTVLAVRTRFVAEVDADGSTINNSATLDTLAGELKDKMVDRLNMDGREYHYGGIVTTAKPGSEIHDMTWRDYGDRAGTITELVKDDRLAEVEQDIPQLEMESLDGVTLLGKTDSTHNKGASGTVSIWAGAAGSESDTGFNVTAYNRFANVGSGKWVWVEFIRGVAYLSAAEC